LIYIFNITENYKYILVINLLFYAKTPIAVPCVKWMSNPVNAYCIDGTFPNRARTLAKTNRPNNIDTRLNGNVRENVLKARLPAKFPSHLFIISASLFVLFTSVYCTFLDIYI